MYKVHFLFDILHLYRELHECLDTLPHEQRARLTQYSKDECIEAWFHRRLKQWHFLLTAPSAPVRALLSHPALSTLLDYTPRAHRTFYWHIEHALRHFPNIISDTASVVINSTTLELLFNIHPETKE